MKHNNELPNNHFKKTAKRYKTWFDQPARKIRRRKIRKMKESKIYPQPLHTLKPIVRCPTIRHNIKERLGRGFTPEECKAAGLDYNYARTIGISVDLRRQNKSQESFDKNVERIKLYLSRLTIYENKKTALESGVQQHKGKLMPVKNKEVVVKAVKVSDIGTIN